MTKKELEELVEQLKEQISGYEEEIERAKMSAAERIAALETQIERLKRSHNPFAVIPTSPTTPMRQNTRSNGPWAGFTMRTPK